MKTVTINKGLKLNIKGAPSSELNFLNKPTHVALLPERIPFIKPRLLVEKGDKVNIGSVLIEDKQDTRIKFLSPGGGEITAINLGHRRVIKEIIIKLDSEEVYENFDRFNETAIKTIDRKKLVKTLMAYGLWPFIKQLPFRKIANPDHIPPTIWISMEGQDPFQPSVDIYLNGKEHLLQFGINILKKLSDNVHVIIASANTSENKTLNGLATHNVSGVYPAGDPGTVLFQTKKDASENQSWYINGQDILFIAKMLKTGIYPTERVFALCGSSADDTGHFQTRMGIPVSHIAPFITNKNQVRCIAGGLFSGYSVSKESFLGLYETSLIIIPEKPDDEFFGFVRPGFHKPSYSKAFLSIFNKADLEVDTDMHGEERACINCGTCKNVCAVDILPQFMYKCLKADEIEEALNHGLLDCVECGICSFVCPSKIELAKIFKDAKGVYYKEQR